MAYVRDGGKTHDAIREAAAELFFQHGYGATSLRTIAAAVGIQVGSLYNHIAGKEELLADLMISVMDDLDARLAAAVGSANGSAVVRLRAAIDAHLRYHATHARETFVGNSELRALGPKNRAIVFARRRNYENALHQLVVDAATEAGVELIEPTLQTYAILALGMHVASWFRDTKRPITLELLIDSYVRVSLRQLGIDEHAGAYERTTR